MIRNAQLLVFFLLYLAVFVLAVVALIDAARRPAAAFTAAGKRTKNVWMAILGVAVAVAFVAIPPPIGLGLLSFLALGSAVAAIVYLVDVKPAVEPHSRRRPGGRGGSGW